jgi:hypothetical protein
MEDRRPPRRNEESQRLFHDAAVARRFQSRLREVGPPAGYARPALQYDESGYPIDGHHPSLADRVRRLITG